MSWRTQARRSITMTGGAYAPQQSVRLDACRLICHGWGKRHPSAPRASCGTGAWINPLFPWTRPMRRAA